MISITDKLCEWCGTDSLSRGWYYKIVETKTSNIKHILCIVCATLVLESPKVRESTIWTDINDK